jgi:formyltetrahydrofolate deformylase
METGVKRLLVWCADQPGIVSAVSAFLFEAGANIVQSDQYSSDPVGGAFFLRMEFTLPAESEPLPELSERFAARVADGFEMGFRFWDASERKRTALLVSRYDH